MNILERIVQYRLDRNWSEYELSVKAGLPQSTISSWYRKGSCPTLESLSRIAQAYGVTLAELVAEDDENRYFNNEEVELVSIYRKMSFYDKANVRAYMQGISDREM